MPIYWTVLLSLGSLVIFVIAGLLAWYAWMSRSRRPSDDGYDYIMVLDDGGAREVTPGEQQYLETEFSPADGARPYIKFRYESLDGRGSVAGFLRRRQLPADIVIREASLLDQPGN